MLSEGSALLCLVIPQFTDSSVRMFNDMDQTRCLMLLLPIVWLHFKKKKKKINASAARNIMGRNGRVVLGA